MKILRMLLIGTLFCFALHHPIRGANAIMGEFCRNFLLRSYLLNRSSSCNSYLYLFTLDCLASKKAVDKMAVAGSYLFLILWIATEDYLHSVCH